MLALPHLNPITERIIGAAIEVHRVNGPGLLESSYRTCMQYELAARDLHFVAERALPLLYKEIRIESAYRVDLIVENVIVVELKAIDATTPVHEAQMRTYMRMAGCPLGLLINFNVPKLVNGVRRWIETRPATDMKTARR
jgi:GxxExxY protein